MKITHFHPEPIETIPFLNAGTGTLTYFEDRLSVHHTTVDRLPDGLSAIIVTADLQGRESVPGGASLPGRLLPCGTEVGQRGDFRIRHVLEQHAPLLVIRGHKHWPHPLAQFPSGLQVLNVDKRVVIHTE
jgi:hypothetical protein